MGYRGDEPIHGLGPEHPEDDMLSHCIEDELYLHHEEESSQMQRAGVDETTDVLTFIEMNGRDRFITEI